MGLLIIVVLLYPFVVTWIVYALVKPVPNRQGRTLLGGLALAITAAWCVGRADEVPWEAVVSGALIVALVVFLASVARESRRLREFDSARRRHAT